MQNLYAIEGKPSWGVTFLITCINNNEQFKKPLRNRKLEREHLVIHPSHAMPCCLDELPPEAGGRIVVTDELGNDVEVY